jgi:putative transposase
VDGTNFRRVLLKASTSQYIPCSKQGRKDTPVKNDAPIDEKEQEQETPKSLLEELIREGARRLPQAAIEQEVTEYPERFREEKDEKRKRGRFY